MFVRRLYPTLSYGNRGVFEELDWQCRDEASSFGNQLCSATIGSFNDFPARYLTAFFADEKLNALKVVYRRHYHEQMLGHLIKTLGQPGNVADAIKGTPDADTVLEWDTGKGIVVLPKELEDRGPREEASLMWLATRR